MKVRAITAFGDWEADVIRQDGEVFEVTKERYAQLAHKLPDFVEEAKPSKTKKAEEE